MALPKLELFPNSTISNTWQVVNAASLHAAIAEPTATPDESDYAKITTNLKEFKVGYQNVPPGIIKVATEIVVKAWVFVALNGATDVVPTFGFVINGSPVIADDWWPELIYNGKTLIAASKSNLTLSEADCNTIETKTISYGHNWVDKSTEMRVYAQQLDVTYESASVVERYVGEIEVNSDPVINIDNDQPVTEIGSIADPLVNISDSTIRKILSYRTPMYEGEIIE
jgi:hypothetical protein